jgi:hypothetical protein
MTTVLEQRPEATLRSREWNVMSASVVGLIAYAFFSVASKGFCPGGFNSDGSYVDGDGNRTDAAPMCLNLTLQPSWLVVVLVVLLAVVVVSASRRPGANAVIVLGSGIAAIALVIVAALVITHVAFWSYPITEWRFGDAVSFPVPLPVDIEIAPMQGR